jgi:hypothetical protein
MISSVSRRASVISNKKLCKILNERLDEIKDLLKKHDLSK